jgi:hypothetical protein
MSTPRRRVLRPPRAEADESLRQQKLLKCRDRLQKERQVLARWVSKLRRAFHAMEKQQRKVARLEAVIAKLERE